MKRRIFSESYIILPKGCWRWTGPANKDGYGTWGGQLAHRRIYIQQYGPIPDWVVIMHRCNNPICVNPEHLLPGTQKHNMEAAAKAGRTLRGDRNPQSKLTHDDILDIRRLLAEGVTQRILAIRFGVRQSSISKINQKKRWGWL